MYCGCGNHRLITLQRMPDTGIIKKYKKNKAYGLRDFRKMGAQAIMYGTRR
jgi:hypothetical protein